MLTQPKICFFRIIACRTYCNFALPNSNPQYLEPFANCFYYINISVLQGFLPLSFTCKTTIFLRVKISANQKSSFVAMFSCLGMDNSSVYTIF